MTAQARSCPGAGQYLHTLADVDDKALAPSESVRERGTRDLSTGGADGGTVSEGENDAQSATRWMTRLAEGM